MAGAAVSIRVDLSKLDLASKREMERGITKGIRAALFRLERVAKQKSSGFVRTGRYRSSIKPKIVSILKGIVGPNVVYGGWVEDGRTSRHAPRTHRKSGFRGHKVFAKTFRAEERKVLDIVNRAVGRVIK